MWYEPAGIWNSANPAVVCCCCNIRHHTTQCFLDSYHIEPEPTIMSESRQKGKAPTNKPLHTLRLTFEHSRRSSTGVVVHEATPSASSSWLTGVQRVWGLVVCGCGSSIINCKNLSAFSSSLLLNYYRLIITLYLFVLCCQQPGRDWAGTKIKSLKKLSIFLQEAVIASYINLTLGYVLHIEHEQFFFSLLLRLCFIDYIHTGRALWTPAVV